MNNYLPIRLTLLISFVFLIAVDTRCEENPKPFRSTKSINRNLTYNKPIAEDAPSVRADGVVRAKTNANQPNLYVLAPDHVGMTTHENPTLYWYQSDATDAATKIEIVINREDQIEPVLATISKKRSERGIHKIDLAKHDAKIQKGVEYQWYVMITDSEEGHANDVLASGFIKRVDPPQTVAKSLFTRNNEDLIYIFAEEGIWYDALECASELIEKHPENKDFRELRAELLDYGDLPVVAEFDRNPVSK